MTKQKYPRNAKLNKNSFNVRRIFLIQRWESKLKQNKVVCKAISKGTGGTTQQIMQNHMGANPSSDRDRVPAHINHPLLINVSPHKVSNLLRINT